MSVKNDKKEFVTIRLAGQLCGIPILDVHDVLSEQAITIIPLSPPAVAGVLNLRGRIVTAIDLRKRLKLGSPDKDVESEEMSIVVESDGEPYSLLIDSVGDVMSFADEAFERNPVTLDACWQEVSEGIYRMDGELMVILDVKKLLNFENGLATAA